MATELNRDQLQKDIHALYAREHAELDTMAHLERAEQFKLGDTLSKGGVLVFPHAGVLDCGYQIAACVQAALDSGSDTVLVVSVLHAFTHEMEMARRRVADGSNPSNEKFWGIQGPGAPSNREEWKGDHALISWRHFWDAEVKRRGIEPNRVPRVVERYPYLAGGKPEQLPGIDELVEIAEDAVIVSTADAFHHGIGYGTPPDEAFDPDEAGLAKATAKLEEGMALLSKGDYWGYNGHCVEAKSDARDAGQVFRYLRGPMSGEVIDITYSEAAALYDAPPPTWVAAAIMEWTLDA